MQPTYTKVLYYHVRFTCITPFRNGNDTLDKATLLRHKDNEITLAAGAIAGAFRHWKDNIYLFGANGIDGTVIFSDAIIHNSQNSFRHRICLRQKIADKYIDTGSDINRTNLDVAVLPRGTTGEFTLIWRGLRPFDEAMALIETYLSALNCGLIQLGAERSNDFGRVKLSVSRGSYDMTIEEQREAWLSGQWCGCPIALPAIPTDNILLDVLVDMPKIFIGSASNNSHYTEDGQLIVPSSSIKGVLRRWCKQLCPVFGDPSLETVLFGAYKLPGTLVVSDGIYTHVHPMTKIPRNRTDRISGKFHGVATSNFEPVSGQLQFQLRIAKGHPKAVGILLYALRDFGLGMFELGGSSALGWGYAQSIQVTLSDPNAVGILSVADGAVAIDDPQGTIAHYAKALGGCKYDT